MGKKVAASRAAPGSRKASAKKDAVAGPRLLVRCESCRQQYDATERAIGSRFRCLCGKAVEVRAPQGHEASVVRCSSCGAPCEEGADHCGFCHADFTVHERDLNTVCPACLARISSQARFCHHCGTAMATRLMVGAVSKLACPCCDEPVQLVSRALTSDGVTALECPRCVGLWLGLESFHLLLSAEPRAEAKASPNHVPRQSGARQGYRRCAECTELMTRRNFGGRSGVVVDVCGRHGVWFDAEELAQLLAWARAGGLEAARDDLARLQNSPDRVRKREVEKRRDDERPAPQVADESPKSEQLSADSTSGADWPNLMFSLLDLFLFVIKP